MSPREKRLLNLLLIVGFVLLNLAAYKLFYEKRLSSATSSRAAKAESKVELAQIQNETMDLYEDEMAWLAKNPPKTANLQDTETLLQRLLQTEAQKNNLTVKRQKLQDSVVDPELVYHRARIEFEVNGMEMSLYRWLLSAHKPKEARAVTFMRMNPQKDDDTKIDCQVIVEQWFVPESEEPTTTT